MPSFGDLFSGESVFGQLLIWQVGGQVFGAVLTPPLTAAAQEVWAAAVDGSGGTVHLVTSPADLADQVTRGIRALADAASEATKSGINGPDFQNMVAAAGEPPGLEQVLEMFRRKIVPWEGVGDTTVSVENAIAKGRLYTYWSDALRQAYDTSQPGGGTPISPADAVEATLRGQAPQADMMEEASFSGLNAARFQILLDTAGNPPAPGELVELYRRGFIPLHGVGPTVLSFQQGIFEGDAKDKWEPLYEHLVDYLPPPRTITTLLSHGVITAAQATQYFQEAGLSPSLAAAYTASATSEKLAANKTLAISFVEKLYYDHLITNAVAAGMLADLGYTAAESAYILELQDFTRAASAYNSAITHVGSLYINHKLTKASAVKALQALDVPAGTSTHLFSSWDAEYVSNVKTLTASQIADVAKYEIKPLAWCIDKLGDLGYDAHDAWVLCSVASLGALPGEPAEGPSGGMAESTTEAG
jgi:hypothetical protein